MSRRAKADLIMLVLATLLGLGLAWVYRSPSTSHPTSTWEAYANAHGCRFVGNNTYSCDDDSVRLHNPQTGIYSPGYHQLDDAMREAAADVLAWIWTPTKVEHDR